MIEATFLQKGEDLAGFTVTGHATANAEDADGKIVCAAVSSAAYMAANTLTEIVKAECDVAVWDGYMAIHVLEINKSTQVVLEGFLLHLSQMQKQYGNIDVKVEA